MSYQRQQTTKSNVVQPGAVILVKTVLSLNSICPSTQKGLDSVLAKHMVNASYVCLKQQFQFSANMSICLVLTSTASAFVIPG